LDFVQIFSLLNQLIQQNKHLLNYEAVEIKTLAIASVKATTSGISQHKGKDIPVINDHLYHFAKAIPKPNQKPGKIKQHKKNPSSSKSNKNKNDGKYRSRRRKRGPM
jgi:predicted YcjX-like family ATPase